jgi:hypothetical protein
VAFGTLRIRKKEKSASELVTFDNGVPDEEFDPINHMMLSKKEH